jgi:16S rRNA processing protein RimM
MIVLGRIVAPFGVHGWLRVHPFGDDPEAWRKMPQWWLSSDVEAPDERWKAHDLEAVKIHGDGVVRWATCILGRHARLCRHRSQMSITGLT